MHQNDDDQVGYRKPPKKNRFKEGQSGNPLGRPKGARNFLTDLKEELRETTEFKDGENVVKVTKQRALIKQIVRKALAGDEKSASTLLDLCLKTSRPSNGDDEQESAETAKDEEITRRYADKL